MAAGLRSKKTLPTIGSVTYTGGDSATFSPPLKGFHVSDTSAGATVSALRPDGSTAVWKNVIQGGYYPYSIVRFLAASTVSELSGEL